MKKFALMLVACSFALGAAFADAACTNEEAQQKAVQLSTQLQALAQKDAARFQALMQEFQAKSQEVQQMKDMDEVCKYYDEMISKSK